MITGLHHVGLSVLNLDAAIDFYTNQHAYNLSHRFDVEDNTKNRAMLQLDNASARGAFLQGSLGCLELFEYACKPEMDQEDKAVYSAGIRHICLQSEISDRLYDGLVAAGATSHARPSGLGTGNSYVYIRDPEGNLLELEGTPWAPEEARRPWFAHVALVTPDISRLTDFYALLTGIDIHRQGSFGPSPKFDHVAGLSDICFTGAWSRLANAELEFWCYAHPSTLPGNRRSLATPGWNHICFESDDIDADYARLVAHGIELHGPPHMFGNARLFFGRDPDGNVFEVLQPSLDKQLTVAAMLQEANGHSVDAARTAYRNRLAATATEA